MRIYTRAGPLAFKTFTFPDGQPHFTLETYERDFTRVTIETAIKSPLELFQLGLAVDVLRNHGYSEIHLDVRYLLGARMDRAIDSMQPHTLQSVARHINALGFAQVRLLDVHSEVATRLIRNSVNVLPHNIVRQAITAAGFPQLVCPDKGAIPRVRALAEKQFADNAIIYCSKKRDMATGKLSSFSVNSDISNPNVIIVDDICDGGGTFVGLAKELRKAGAKKVYLYVTHGIFSKGLPLEGIDKIYTTDSYCVYATGREFRGGTTVIPVSMKELK